MCTWKAVSKANNNHFRRQSAAMNDSDIIHPEPGYSSVQAASREPERREYTPLQQEENASYTDEM